jgi:hypothetical protein
VSHLSRKSPLPNCVFDAAKVQKWSRLGSKPFIVIMPEMPTSVTSDPLAEGVLCLSNKGGIGGYVIQLLDNSILTTASLTDIHVSYSLLGMRYTPLTCKVKKLWSH